MHPYGMRSLYFHIYAAIVEDYINSNGKPKIRGL